MILLGHLQCLAWLSFINFNFYVASLFRPIRFGAVENFSMGHIYAIYPMTKNFDQNRPVSYKDDNMINTFLAVTPAGGNNTASVQAMKISQKSEALK